MGISKSVWTLTLATVLLAQVIFVPPLSRFQNAEAHSPGISLSGFTSSPPSIDGIIRDSEWANAAKMEITITGLGIAIPATMYVMNDATNLYLALKAKDTAINARSVWIVFDDDHDGILEVGEDHFFYDPPYWSSVSLPPSNFDAFVNRVDEITHVVDFDNRNGGTLDGNVAASQGIDTNNYEFSHPLCSADLQHDFCLSTESIAGLFILYGIQGFGVLTWPAGAEIGNDASKYGDIVIASAQQDNLPIGTIVTSLSPSPEPFYNFDFTDPGPQAHTFPGPSGPVTGIWTSVTTTVTGAILYFDIGGVTYSKIIVPNSNTLLVFNDAKSVSNVRVSINGRVFANDAATVAYSYGSSSSTLDLSILGPPQLVQAVFNPDINGDGIIDLVKDKPAAAFDYVVITGSIADSKLLQLDLLQDGVKISSLSITAGQVKQQGNIVKIQFTPADTGNHQLRVKISSADVVDANLTNDLGLPAEVEVKDTIPVKMVFFPVEFEDELPFFYDDSIDAGATLMRAMFPVNPTRFVLEDKSADVVVASELFSWAGIFTDLNTIAAKTEMYNADRGIGIVSAGYFDNLLFSYVGQSQLGGTSVIVQNNYYTGIPHEIGHTYGLQHIPIIFPQGDTIGYWADEDLYEHARIYDDNLSREINSLPSFMSTGNAPLQDLSVWIQDSDYDTLFEQFRESPDDPRLLFISGLITEDDEIVLQHWFIKEEGVPDEVPEGDYAVRILDVEGSVLDEVKFDAPFEVHDKYGAPVETDVSGFAFTIPYPENSFSLVILKNDEILAETKPAMKVLHDAVDSIPEDGFYKNPAQLRNALHNKISVLEKMISASNFAGAVEKLNNDIRPALQRWLNDAYPVEDVLDVSKAEILSLVDSLAQDLVAEKST